MLFEREDKPISAQFFMNYENIDISYILRAVLLR